MRIAVPKEIKNHEYRVGLTPASVRELVAQGQEVWVQTGAGAGIALDDGQYRSAGAQIAQDAAEVYARGDLLIKVKEPSPPRSRCCALVSCCTPTCTWRPTPRRRLR